MADTTLRAEQIGKAQRAEPFRPFKLHLADGREFLVDHPEFLLIDRSSRTVVVADVDGGIEIVDPLLVTSLSAPAG